MTNTITATQKVTVKKVAPGYYETAFPVRLFLEGREFETTATAEIMRRDDGSGWSFTLEADGCRLSQHEDVYEAKKHILEFFNSPLSRQWAFYGSTSCGYWAMGGAS